MSFADEFEETERKVLVENTAQGVFNILKDLENQVSLHASRWIWELLQNARDASSTNSPLHICVSITNSEVVFQHNGSAFTKDQVAHLIFHGSTKSQNTQLIGRYGTGFLSSHIISKKPHISGRLDNGQYFSFILDRTGNTHENLSDSMKRSRDDFVNSVTNEPTIHVEHSTKFVYPLDSSVKRIALQGVESLEAFAPYVLTFNDEIESIEITKEGNKQVYNRQASRLLNENVCITPIDVQQNRNEGCLSYLVASITKEPLSVAVVCKQFDNHNEIQFGPDVPKFFIAFPLFGTEDIGLPGAVNSRQFIPLQNRDGLYLGEESSEDNNSNKKLVEQTCPLFLILLAECAKSRWKGIDLLCKISTVGSITGVDKSWLQLLIKNSIIDKIRSTELLVTCGDQLISPKNAQIPLGSPNVHSEDLWQLLHDLSDSDSMLVEQSTALSWEENIRGWGNVMDASPEAMSESMTTEKCADKLHKFESLNSLREALRPECDPLQWCNKLFELIVKAKQTQLFDSLSLLPDQNGNFQSRDQLHNDIHIDEQLKDIGEQLDHPIRSCLLNKEIDSIEISKLLRQKTNSEVLHELCDHLQKEAQKDQPVSGFRNGNIQLFVWILKKGEFESLNMYPALTKESYKDDEAPKTMTLRTDAEADMIPLAPPECWPEDSREFSELFPMRYVISSDYIVECPDSDQWSAVSKRNYVRLSPIIEVADYVKDFVPDDHLEDDVDHKSKERITTTQIAFLRTKDVGLIDSARKSKTKCLMLIRFFAAYMIRADLSWEERLDTECECDKPHKYLKAGWITPLKKLKWIYLEKNRSDKLSVESLARILNDQDEIVKLLSGQTGTSFLSELGVSAGDFLMRAVTTDEHSRVSLSQSVIQIFQAAGGDIQQVNELANEISSHPDTLKGIQERVENRKKVKRNQRVGKAVEQAFQSALSSDHGLIVKRVPIGSDYSVEPENDYLDEDGNEFLLHVGGFLIEIKTTVGTYVRMTDVQGKKAREYSDNYALCVVPMTGQDQEINKLLIRENSKFVFDIGAKIKPLVEALESLEGSKEKVLTTTGEIELEMQGQSVKFKIGHEVWEAGIGFSDAVQKFGGHDKTTESVAIDVT